MDKTHAHYADTYRCGGLDYLLLRKPRISHTKFDNLQPSIIGHVLKYLTAFNEIFLYKS